MEVITDHIANRGYAVSKCTVCAKVFELKLMYIHLCGYVFINYM